MTSSASFERRQNDNQSGASASILRGRLRGHLKMMEGTRKFADLPHRCTGEVHCKTPRRAVFLPYCHGGGKGV